MTYYENLHASAMLLLLLFLCFTSCTLPGVKALYLTIPSSGTKCVSEELHSNVVVLADYSVFHDVVEGSNLPSSISVKVKSPYGNSLHENKNVSGGQFGFTTAEAGYYLACFWVDGNNNQGATTTVSLDWKIGISTRDWDLVAKKEKIEGVELELKKLEGLVQQIHEDLLFLKDMEAEMREMDENTKGRVARLGIMSLGVCILASIMQLLHLKRYFQKKKLI